MKKLSLIILMSLAVFSVSGCSDDDKKVAEENQREATGVEIVNTNDTPTTFVPRVDRSQEEKSEEQNTETQNESKKDEQVRFVNSSQQKSTSILP